MKSLKSLWKICLLSLLFSSCNGGIKTGTELTKAELNYFEKIGVKEKDEVVLLFDSQLNLETSGNLITNMRLASYWIENRPEKSKLYSALYSEIDSIYTKDLTNSKTYSSYINVRKKDGTEFKVYVDESKEETEKFFSIAYSEWKKHDQ